MKFNKRRLAIKRSCKKKCAAQKKKKKSHEPSRLFKFFNSNVFATPEFGCLTTPKMGVRNRAKKQVFVCPFMGVCAG